MLSSTLWALKTWTAMPVCGSMVRSTTSTHMATLACEASELLVGTTMQQWEQHVSAMFAHGSCTGCRWSSVCLCVLPCTVCRCSGYSTPKCGKENNMDTTNKKTVRFKKPKRTGHLLRDDVLCPCKLACCAVRILASAGKVTSTRVPQLPPGTSRVQGGHRPRLVGVPGGPSTASAVSKAPRARETMCSRATWARPARASPLNPSVFD